MPQEIHNYFVHYTFTKQVGFDTISGSGRTEVETEGYITKIDDIESMEKHLSKVNNFVECVITNFILFPKQE